MLRDRLYAKSSKQGFTLIEILLVVAIIGILAALAAPRLVGRAKDAKKAAAKVDIQSIGTALDLYELDNGDFPSSLQALVNNPGGNDSWRGPYLKNGVPSDPWGADYIYQFPGAHNSHGYDMRSLGPDGTESADDLTNWQSSQ